MRKKLDDKSEQRFLDRWARKKAESENLPDVIDDELEQNEKSKNDLIDVPTSDSHAEETRPLTDEDMPPIESLNEHSDYAGFLSPGVSDGLRKLALRKLFHSEKFNIRDGLDDYDEDFRSFAALGDIITSDMKHQIEMAEEKRKKAAQEKENKNVEQTKTAEDEQIVEDETKQPLESENIEGNELADNDQRDGSVKS